MSIYNGHLSTSNALAGNITVDRFSGNGSTQAFTLSVVPGNVNNTNVYISGVYQAKTNYSVSATTITFSAAPPSGTNNVEVLSGTTVSLVLPTMSQGGLIVGGSGGAPQALNVGSSGSVLTSNGTSPAWSSSVTIGGSLGVGTAPSDKLHIYSSSGDVVLREQSSAGNCYIVNRASTSTMDLLNSMNGPMAFSTNNTERMRIDATGRTLIGLTTSGSTNAKLQITGGTSNGTTLATAYSEAATVFTPKSTSGYSLACASGTSDFPLLQVSANGSAAGNLLIQPYGGNVGIGGTPTELFTVTGNTGSVRVDSTGTNLQWTRNGLNYLLAQGGTSAIIQVIAGASGGVQLNNTATSWSAVSDERLKTIIEPITGGLNKVASLRTVIGRYNNDLPDKRRVFLIAQDVQAVLPEAVTVGEDEAGTLSLSYTDTIPLLINAIKELSTQNTALMSRIEALENK